MAPELDQQDVRIPVVAISDGRQITFAEGLTESLNTRSAEIRRAILASAETISQTVAALPEPPSGWHVDEFSATFGVTLSAEAGVIVSKASVDAAFEVSFTFKRRD